MIGIVLAGGRASRMGGGDKGDLCVAGVPILDRVVACLRAQCDDVAINANGEAHRFSRYGHPVVADAVAGHPGPLAGLLAGLDHVAMHHPAARHVVTAPTDTPFLPLDLVARLQDSRIDDRADIVCARSADAIHPVVALWSVALREDLRHALVDLGLRRVRDFIGRHAVAYVTWPVDPVDPFFNVNTPDDLVAADRFAALSARAARHANAMTPGRGTVRPVDPSGQFDPPKRSP